VNILDENIPEHQRQKLKNWRIRVYQISDDVGRNGIKDDEIITFLLTKRRSTFFSRDDDFYQRQLCHARYCLVHLSVSRYDAAIFIRRFLHHSEFNTQIKRMGTIIRISQIGVHLWQQHAEEEIFVSWND
jgi:hypothetical protein